MLVKRILALEGDVVKTLPPYPDQEIVVPQGHVWVEGLILPYILFFYKIIQEPYRRWTFLQRWQQSFWSGTISNSSILAHLFYWLFFFCKIPRALLDSKLVMIIWPLSRFGPINRPELPPNNYGQANRLAMTQLEREKARHSRVSIQSWHNSTCPTSCQWDFITSNLTSFWPL